ncbi:MAG: hypothetical protein OIF32_08335 [Campylobacterales bacterium]|nr:hypothetical protein [Campylobacterales bacterium]
MNWQEKFNNEIFDVVNKYEYRHDMKIESISVEEGEIDGVGKKTINVSSTFKINERPQESKESKGFLSNVLIPAVGTFTILALLMEFIF